MIPIDEFVTLAVIHFLAIASPGPNVIATITNAFTHGLKAGVLTSLGIAAGNLFHIALGIFGVTVLINTYPELGVLISLLGISYLAYMGITRIRKGFRQKTDTNLVADDGRSENFFLSGIIINITNLKGGLFFLMAFSSLISLSNPLGVKIFYGFWMAAVNFLFLSGLAWLFRKRSLTGRSFMYESAINMIGGVAYLIVALALLFPLLKTANLW